MSVRSKVLEGQSLEEVEISAMDWIRDNSDVIEKVFYVKILPRPKEGIILAQIIFTPREHKKTPIEEPG